MLSSVESETNSFYFKIKCHKDFSTKPKNHCKAYVVKKENIVRTEYSPKPFFTLLKVYQYFWEALEVTSSSKNLLRVLLHNAKVNIQNKSSEINVGAKVVVNDIHFNVQFIAIIHQQQTLVMFIIATNTKLSTRSIVWKFAITQIHSK